jgi:hypothetical protein
VKNSGTLRSDILRLTKIQWHQGITGPITSFLFFFSLGACDGFNFILVAFYLPYFGISKESINQIKK